MPLPRRFLLTGAVRLAAALGLAGGPGPAVGAATTAPLRRRLEICRPLGDPLAELLRRNAAFAAVWQEVAASGDPLERARLLQEQQRLLLHLLELK